MGAFKRWPMPHGKADLNFSFEFPVSSSEGNVFNAYRGTWNTKLETVNMEVVWEIIHDKTAMIKSYKNV
jgi:hypothetical protein